MERDTMALWLPPERRRPFRRESISFSEEDFRVSTGLDGVPRIIVRMLASVAMLLLSAVIVVCIHMYARNVSPGQEYVPPMEGEPRKPDLRNLDITLGPPDTDTPAPHKAPAETTEFHTASEAHNAVATLTSVKAQGASSIGLRQNAMPKLPHAPTAAHAAVREQSSLGNTTSAAKHDKWRPLASVATLLGIPTKGNRDSLACSTIHKSFCGNSSGSPAAQFFYDPEEKSCLLVTVQKAHVCNRSPNQFASRQECETACVINQPAPEPRCSERPRFVACTAADVHNPWWFHDGHECTPWSFAGGRCPAASAPVFSAAVECKAQCSRPEELRERGCLFPESQTCEPSQLRRPFFAVPKGARFECHEVEPELLVRHRCLLGPNSFASWEECDETCHVGKQNNY